MLKRRRSEVRPGRAARGLYAWVLLPLLAVGVDGDGSETTAAAERVIARVDETYSHVRSARGRIARATSFSGTEQRYEGRFAAEKPERLLVEFVGDEEQVVVCDGQKFRAYFPGPNQGLYQTMESLSPMERFVLGPGPFFGNLLPLLQDGYVFDIAETVGGNHILRATPVRPAHFNFILLAIDPETWTIRAVEHFDRANQLMSQTRFLEFESIGDSLFLPTLVQSSTVTEDGIVTETTRLSRLLLNTSLDATVFRTPGDEHTEWSQMPESGPP